MLWRGCIESAPTPRANSAVPNLRLAPSKSNQTHALIRRSRQTRQPLDYASEAASSTLTFFYPRPCQRPPNLLPSRPAGTGLSPDGGYFQHASSHVRDAWRDSEVWATQRNDDAAPTNKAECLRLGCGGILRYLVAVGVGLLENKHGEKSMSIAAPRGFPAICRLGLPIRALARPTARPVVSVVVPTVRPPQGGADRPREGLPRQPLAGSARGRLRLPRPGHRPALQGGHCRDPQERRGRQKASFPDLETNAFGFTADDPIEPNRVWYFVRPRGTFSGKPFKHPVVGDIEATGAKVIAPPEARSMVFDDEGKIKHVSVGYVVDRFTGDTTGGKGAVFGLSTSWDRS